MRFSPRRLLPSIITATIVITIMFQAMLIRDGLGIAMESLGAGAGYAITLASRTRVTIVLLNGDITDTPVIHILELSLCGRTTSGLLVEAVPDLGS